MTFKTKIFMSAAVAVFTLSGCGGGSSGGGTAVVTPPTPPSDTTAPSVSFNPAALTVESGMTGSSTVTATDAVGVTSGPAVTCTNGGSFSGSTFTAPAVTADTTSVCTATAGDAAGNQGTATLTVSITPPPAASHKFEGFVVKGAISGATTVVTDSSEPLDADATALVSDVTAADGGFSLEIPEGTTLSDLLIVTSLLGGANMVCDAANCQSEGGIAFGSPLTIPADPDPGTVRFLSAAVPTPAAFGTTDVNVNMFTHFQVIDMIGVSLARQGAGGVPTIALQDYAAARESTAAIFGLPNTDCFSIPFVDVTQTITSTDQNAIYAALLSGGLLGAALEEPDPFAAILDLQVRTATDNVLARESVDRINVISLEDIFQNATALAAQIGATGNAFTGAQDALSDRETAIAAAAPDRPIAADGSFLGALVNPTFSADNISLFAAETSTVVDIVNPEGIAFTASVVAGAGSEFFEVFPIANDKMQIDITNFGNPPPVGNYTLNVSFDTNQSDPSTDSLEIALTEVTLNIVEESATISKAQTNQAIFTLNNPGNFEIDIIMLTGTGSEFFFLNQLENGNLEVMLVDNSVPNDTYNLTVSIEALPPGGALPNTYTDMIEIIVTP